MPLTEFRGRYSSHWSSSADRNRALRLELESRFPVLKGAIRVGHGAENPGYLPSLPHQNNEADLTLLPRGRLVCHIELTGSEKATVPPDEIWLLPSKVVLANRKEAAREPYFWWLDYPNKSYVLTPARIRGFPCRVVWPTIRGLKETYLAFPPEAALPREYLFQWLREHL